MTFTEQELKRLSTHRLVALKRAHYPNQFGSYDGQDMDGNYSKYSKEYDLIKAILATRGHVPRKHEKKGK